MTQEEYNNHPGWQWCTPEGAELHTLLLGLQTTFREKLEWLEDAETISLNLRASREARLQAAITARDQRSSPSQ